MAPQSGWPNVLSEEIGIYVLMAIGLNVVVGQAGMLDLGYVAFYAVGGYAVGICRDQAPLGFLVHPAGRHRLRGPGRRDPRRADPAAAGDYLAIVTLGFGLIISRGGQQLNWDGGPRASRPSRTRRPSDTSAR